MINKMNTLLILFADKKSSRKFDKAFEGLSAFEKSLFWAKKHSEKIVVLGYDEEKSDIEKEIACAESNAALICRNSWNVQEILNASFNLAEEKQCETVAFSFADLPFLNDKITEEIFSRHQKYQAEYTFQDGLPYGFAPEVFAKDTLKILSALADSKSEFKKADEIARDSFFSLLKTEINSFEIETVISSVDFKMHRLSFDCGSKAGLTACSELFNMKIASENPEEIASRAVKNIRILKTVPSYYNIQISEKCTGKCLICPYAKQGISKSGIMELSKFKALCGKIADFSEHAVISLSSWGEALNHPDFADFVEEVLSHEGLSVLIETDGLLVTEELSSRIKTLVEKYRTPDSGLSPVMWIVALDSFTPETYGNLRGGNAEDFERSVNSVSILQKDFPGNVYPQLTRVNQNEGELEQFWRFWSDRNNASGGSIIVQKYNSFSERLEDLRPADISPLGRNVCWHLLRDMNIFADGTVVQCHEIFEKENDSFVLGNVFEQELSEIWEKQTALAEKHLNCEYNDFCGKCDEWYTFNF